MQAVLVMFRSDGEKRSFSLSREMTVVGRRQDCDLMIPLGEISRKHCRIIKEADSLRLEDMGSSNGTYHNGRRVQEAVLSPGDTIQVGPVTFVLQIDGVPGDDEITPYGAARAAGAEDTAHEVAVEPGMGEGGDDAMPTEGAYEHQIGNEEVLDAVEEMPAQTEDELEVLPDDAGQEAELEILDDNETPPPPPRR